MSHRLMSGIAVGVLAVAGTVTLGVAPAAAAPASGELQLKGAGSLYTRNFIINLSGAPGTIVKSTVKVVNTGSESKQFKVVLTQPAAPVTTAWYLGSALIPSDTYFTPFIAPGKFLLITLKSTVPASAPQGDDHDNGISLSDPITDDFLDSKDVDVWVAAPAHGTQANDLYIKTGAQAFVGGSRVGQYITAIPIKPGTMATFTVRLQNDSAATATTVLTGSTSCPGSAWVQTIKNGTANITNAVFNASGFGFALAPGTHKDLTLTSKLTAPDACTGFYVTLTADGLHGEPTIYESAHAVEAAG